MNQKVVILYGKLSENPDADELDVLDEVSTVKEILISLNYNPIEVEFDLNIEKTQNILMQIQPVFAFNIVETIDNRGELHYICAALLEYLKIPFTGVSSEHLMLTTNKVLTKKILRYNNIHTADWFMLNQIELLDLSKRYIVKPIKEDGSLDIDEDSVFYASDKQYIEKLKTYDKKRFFIEEFIPGREFNVSIIIKGNEPEVLPIAEMKFYNYPEGKPMIMGYSAKWKENTFEYDNTSRTFDIDFVKPQFKEEIESICKKCWYAFESTGYIRVDIRLSEKNIPYVIEINGNPCITPGSGFYSAIEMAGYTFTDAIKMIIADAMR